MLTVDPLCFIGSHEKIVSTERDDFRDFFASRLFRDAVSMETSTGNNIFCSNFIS
jgi:hypothetical protein